MEYNIQVDDAKYFNFPFLRIVKKHKCKENKENAKIVSRSFDGKYSLAFKDIVGWKFFNKIKTSTYLKDCEYYPKTRIAKSREHLDQLNLRKGGRYFVKSKFGDKSQNVAFMRGSER